MLQVDSLGQIRVGLSERNGIVRIVRFKKVRYKHPKQLNMSSSARACCAKVAGARKLCFHDWSESTRLRRCVQSDTSNELPKQILGNSRPLGRWIGSLRIYVWPGDLWMCTAIVPEALFSSQSHSKQNPWDHPEAFQNQKISLPLSKEDFKVER